MPETLVILFIVFLLIVIPWSISRRMKAGSAVGFEKSKAINPPIHVDRSAANHPEIQRFMREHKKIEAIKVYREITGAGLKESKDAIEALEAGRPVTWGDPEGNSPLADIGEGGDAGIRELIRRGNKIEAIKIYREFTGVGLKEAKDAVEALEREMKGQSDE